MLEKVQLNEKEGNLIKAVIEDVALRYGRKETLPVAVADLR